MGKLFIVLFIVWFQFSGFTAIIRATKLRDMEFGVLESPTITIQIVVSPSEINIQGISAKVNISGDVGQEFEAYIDEISVTLSDGNGNNMTVDNFLVGDGTTSDSTYKNNFPSSGAMDLYVGATLTINANQVAGTYTGSCTFVASYINPDNWLEAFPALISVNITAIVVENISVTLIRNLSFGTIIVPGVNTVYTVSPAETNIQGESAKFLIDGADGYSFTINILNPSITITGGNGTTMQVSNFLIGDGVTSGSIYSGTFPAGSGVIIYVGADLTVNANQDDGTYTGTNTLQVNYN